MTAPAGEPEPDPYVRLAAFKARHPAVVIGKAEFGAGWEAQVPLPRNGESYFKPRPLDLLLDALEEELGDSAT